MVERETEVKLELRVLRVIVVWLVCRVFLEVPEALEKRVSQATLDCKVHLENRDQE
jgi:hypothetical protein